MNRNGRLRTWGDAEFARKLVKFAKIEVDAGPADRRATSSPSSSEVFGPGALQLLGHGAHARTTRPTSPARSPTAWSGPSGSSKQAVLHLVGAGGAAPRGRRHDPDGPPGPPTRARRTATRQLSKSFELPQPAELQRGRPLRQGARHVTDAPRDEPGADRPARSSTTRAAPARCGRSTTASASWSGPCGGPASSTTR